jgi:hypothetical protein
VPVCAVILAGGAGAQTVRNESPAFVGSAFDDYVRLLQLTGAAPLASRMLRPGSRSIDSVAAPDSADAWARLFSRPPAAASPFAVAIYDPELRLTENSAVPFGRNDGALWAGKGVSGAVTFGGDLRWRGLTVRLAPTATFSQNAGFPIDTVGTPADMSPYADAYLPARIDLPQRFGDKSIRRLDWGQSGVSARSHGVAAGYTHENMWWGPGVLSSLTMTNNAPGFPHAFIGTDKPVSIGIGRLEALYTIGWLHQSDFWKLNPPDSLTRRWMNAVAMVYEPRWAPGLYLGGVREFYAYVPPGGLAVADYLDVLQPLKKASIGGSVDSLRNDRRDQMLSLFGRWVFPESGLEIYGEFGRNDHSWDWRDFILEPDHSAAYLMGLQKVFRNDGGFVRVGGESVHLAEGVTRNIRAEPPWYTHHIVTQGYTERGQVIGSADGPGGLSRRLWADSYRTWGSVGGTFEWQRVNDDAFFSRFHTDGDRVFHDVFLGVGARGTWITDKALVSLSVMRQHEYNRYWIQNNDVVNLHAELSAQIRLRPLARTR